MGSVLRGAEANCAPTHYADTSVVSPMHGPGQRQCVLLPGVLQMGDRSVPETTFVMADDMCGQIAMVHEVERHHVHRVTLVSTADVM